MKTKTAILTTLILVIGMGLVSCKKETHTEKGLSDFDQILGTYTGSFNYDGLKTSLTAHAEVKLNPDSSIWVHCYGGEYDTTFILDVFNQGDSIFVCLTGNDFMNEYGHTRNHQGSMMNGSNNNNGGKAMGGYMMGGNTNLTTHSTGWADHLRVDHHGSAETHFGGFDMRKHTFGYRFGNPNNSEIFITFAGVKDSK